VGTSTAYVAEILVTGLQATIWLILAVLIVVGVDWINEPTAYEQLTNWATLITVFVVGFAYALGVIVDRVADSALHRIDRWFRKKWFDTGYSSPGPVQAARLQVMAQEEALNDFLGYVRSRMRLARATSFNLILITTTASVLLATRTSASCSEIMATIVGGLGLSLFSVFAWARISRTYYRRLKQANRRLKQAKQGL
jgi:hypothetical protein